MDSMAKYNFNGRSPVFSAATAKEVDGGSSVNCEPVIAYVGTEIGR